MAAHYTVSRDKAKQLVADLIGEVAKDSPSVTDVPMEKLLNAGFTQTTLALDCLAKVITENVQLREDTDAETALAPVTEAFKRINDLTKSIQFVCQIKAAKEEGLELVGAEMCLINHLYEEVSAEQAKESISDQGIKSLSTFTGDQGSGNQVDIILEQFLESAFKISTTNLLSYACCCRVIIRKLGGTALLLYKAWLEQNQMKESDITLAMLVHFLEKRFALHSSPKQAMIALGSLPTIKDHGYLKAVGHISRLCRLSVRKENPDHRKLLFETRANECFRNSLTTSDRAKVLEKDRERLEQGMTQMNYNKMAEFLTQCHTENGSMGRDYDHNMLSSLRINDDEDEGEDHAYQAWNQRGRGFSRTNRGRGRGGYSNGRGGQAPPPRGGYGGPRGQNGASAPVSGFPRGGARGRGNGYRDDGQYQHQRGQRGSGPAPRARSSRARGAQRGRDAQYDGQKQYDRPFVRNEDLNVPYRGCLLCGQIGHSFQSDKCPYFGRTKLWTTPCPSCGVGGHSRQSCLTKPSPGGQGGIRRNRAQNVKEDGNGQQVQSSGSEEDLDEFLAELPNGGPQNFY